MIPRTAKVAAYVQSTFTNPQYLDYGNVILNGYVTTANAVSTAGASGGLDTLSITTAGTNYANGTYTNVYLSSITGSFGFATVTVAGGAVTGVAITSAGENFTVGDTIKLSNITRASAGTTAVLTVGAVDTRIVQPVFKGWTTNFSSYYTEIPPVAAPYANTYPGMDAGGFEYVVHSYKPPTGTISSIGFTGPMGSGYTDGIYTGVATTTGAFGSGATLNIVVAGGQVQTAFLNNVGAGYPVGTTLGVAGGAIGPGTGFSVVVTSISTTSLGGEPFWSQRPVNAQAQVNSLFPLPGVGGWIYPVGDSAVPPPIGTL
jgi:hypothetical protein